jgi:hypothetical protein
MRSAEIRPPWKIQQKKPYKFLNFEPGNSTDTQGNAFSRNKTSMENAAKES